ncbi:MAG TPA: hypothetical protein VNX21_06020 [Candidatus Thermoplasmatota archaeon]|nr:hypothetical protein [Candidatus Thermoplasmatota archaeon]
MSRDVPPQVWAEQAAASAAMTTALSNLAYPTTRAEAIRRVGDLEVDEGIPLGLLLQGVSDESFRDYGTAAKALDKHWGRIARTLAQIDAAEQAARQR